MRNFIFSVLCMFSLIVRAHEGGNFIASDLLSTMEQGDKAALLMVHFGTSYDETRAVTIDAINARAKATFPELEVREAYSSRIVIRLLKKRGTVKLNPLDALLNLRGEGYTHIVVQSSHILEGVEMESLRRDVAAAAPFFKEIRIGTPLLYTTGDMEKVASVFESRKPEKGHLVLVGHGTYTPTTATYAMMDYIFKANGSKQIHVGTVEGYPTYHTVLAQLKAAKAKHITLAPMMFVAGDHARNDIAGEWKEMLEKEGFSVDVRLEGMGEIPQIQEILIDHIRFILHHKMQDITEKKKRYAKE
jgi:sirohydrochlorin cobaltochelatase